MNYLLPIDIAGESEEEIKDDGIQFHADGAIKATWPAFLPSIKTKPDWAVYGNTASYIIERFKDGHPSASAANCEYVLVLVLDVGSRIPIGVTAGGRACLAGMAEPARRALMARLQALDGRASRGYS